MYHVRAVSNGRTIKSVSGKIKDWHSLRVQRESIMRQKIFRKILNGVWKAVRREQKSGMATVWVAVETHPIGYAPSTAFDRADRLTSECCRVVTSMGYIVEQLHDDASYFCYPSRTSYSGQSVTMIGVRITNLHMGDLDLVREMLFSKNDLESPLLKIPEPRLVKKK